MNFFRKAKFASKVIGTPTLLRTFWYGIYRDWVNLRYRKWRFGNLPAVPGRSKAMTQSEAGVRLQYSHFELAIRFLCDDLVRVTWTPGPVPVPYAIAKNAWEPAELEVEFEENEGETERKGDIKTIALRSAALEMGIHPNGGIDIALPGGAVLAQMAPPIRRGTQWTQTSPLRSEERIFGLGERAAAFNLRPGQYRMWNEDPGGSYGPGVDPLYMGIPTYLGLHHGGSYMIFFENPFPGIFDFGEAASIRFDDGALQYYFIPGPPNRALDRYTQLTGRPLMPPRWVLGYHQSRWGYKNEKQVTQVVEGFERNNLPLDALHLDIDYMDDYRVFTVNKSRFPDLPRMVQDLKKRGIQVVPILDCGVKKDPEYRIYRQGLERGMFCTLPNGKPVSALVWPGWSVFPDFTNPQVREWWGDQYQRLLSAGFGGIWHDMNEPAAFTAWGLPTLPTVTKHDMEGRGGDHREAHNVYGLLMARAGYEALEKHQPEKRPWLLTRSGWAGIQRYSWHWTGDTQTSWEMLRHTLHALLGLGLSGVPFSGSDIGGFSGSPTPELFLRWFQFASLTPFFRNHAAQPTPPREPWQFGGKIMDILRTFLALREQLIPYLYTHTWEASQTGVPLMRPLFWSDFQNERLWEASEAYLLGPNLLVAPVFEAGAVKKDLPLPAGSWINYWDNSAYEGGQTIAVDLTWETIPLFVRGGSILPMQGEKGLILMVYPPAKGTAESYLYSDAGDGNGPNRVDRFRVQNRDDFITIYWDQVRSDYLFPYSTVTVEIIGPDTDKAWIDNETVSPTENRLTVGYFQEIRFRKRNQ